MVSRRRRPDVFGKSKASETHPRQLPKDLEDIAAAPVENAGGSSFGKYPFASNSPSKAMCVSYTTRSA